jgi:hypothetical protein
MANRAFLYPTDTSTSDNGAALLRIRSLGDCYCDSRHNVPFAWLFFWSPEQMMPEYESWPDSNTIFIAPRLVACDLFESRLPILLNSAIEIPEPEPMARRLLAKVRTWESEYLRLDTSQVWQSGQEDRTYILPVLDAVHRGDVTEIRRLYPLADKISGLWERQQVDFEMQFIGALYS